MKKIQNYFKKYILKNYKYQFEEFIPNSFGLDKEINNLISMNINSFTQNMLAVISEYRNPKIINLEELSNNLELEKKINKLFIDFGSDKTLHGYEKLYSYIFENLNNIEYILEIGIGTNNPNAVSSMGIKGTPGASLKAFSKMFPDAKIIGADIDKNILINEKNIQSFFLDQNNFDSFHHHEIKKNNYDLIIDDGLHMQSANLNTVRFAIQNLKVNGFVIIEDVSSNALNTWHILSFLLKDKFSVKIVECIDNYAVILQKN